MMEWDTGTDRRNGAGIDGIRDWRAGVRKILLFFRTKTPRSTSGILVLMQDHLVLFGLLTLRSVALKYLQIHSIRVLHEDRERSAAELDNLLMNGDDRGSRSLHLRDRGTKFVHLDAHASSAGVARPHLKLGSRHPAE